jgi:ubiquinone/menaquinone biosynthesis C-methylase UbiE
MERYTYAAKWYDALSAETVYRPGRVAAIGLLELTPGARVLDVGCGTGLNFTHLLQAVGPTGQLVGLDVSPQMLSQAQAKLDDSMPGQVRLVEGDAQLLDETSLQRVVLGELEGFDAVVMTYTLSLMPQWRAAWSGALGLLRDGGRAAVVDMAVPHGRARLFEPLARAACWAGGSDIDAHPWVGVETDCVDVRRASLRGGHIQVRVGTLSKSADARSS